MNRLFPLASALILVGLVGCDAAEYYPHHEAAERSDDLRKEGSGSYGGNNSAFPVGTPGTATPAAPATGAVPATPTQAAPSSSAFQQGGSYSGAATGASGPDGGHSVPLDGTTSLGTTAGR